MVQKYTLKKMQDGFQQIHDQGEVIIDGSAGDGVGQGIYGGTVVVKRDVGSRTGEIMKNGTIIVGEKFRIYERTIHDGGRIIILGHI